MTEAPGFRLQALVTMAERPIVFRAAKMLAGCLTTAGEATWSIDYAFADEIGDLDPAGPAIVITSLLQEVERLDEPWAAHEARLRELYTELSRDPERSVYVCTVFRHIDAATPRRQDRLLRIRRLNLLAATLSHELGVLVADLDRDLADTGAQNLQTDYRLQGPYATAAAAKSLALTMLLVGLDHAVPFDAQEKARRLLKSFKVKLAAPVPQRRYLIGEMVRRVEAGGVAQVVL